MRKVKYRQNKSYIYTVIAVLLTSLVLTALYIYHFNNSSILNFKQFEPTYLPDNMTIDRRIVQNDNPPGINILAQKSLYMEVYSPGFGIWQYRSTGKKLCFLNPDNSDCTIEISPNGQRYSISTSYDFENRAIIHGINLVIEGTQIWMNNGGASTNVYSKEEWDKVVDSLTQTEYDNLPFENVRLGP